MKLRHVTRVIGSLTLVSAVVLATSAWASASPPAAKSSPRSTTGGTIISSIMGVPGSGVSPNYLLPVITFSTFTGPNIGAQQLVWRPLIMYSNSLGINWSESIATSATGVNGDTAVLVKMGSKWKWSDGQPVTAYDVEFEWNLIKASCPTLSNCSYGAASATFPSEVKDLVVINSHELRIDLRHKFYIPGWVLNHLVLFSPLPAQVMSKNPTTGHVYCSDTYCNSPAQAAADLKFLQGVADQPSNPVWSVADGPWKVGPWVTNQSYTFVRNPNYTGGPLAKASKLIWEYFTSDTAEYSALRSGSLDVGYVPITLAREASIPGYRLYKFEPLLAEFINLNQGSLDWSSASVKCTRAICKMFNMLAVRQALQYAIDEPSWVSTILHGDALSHCSTIAVITPQYLGPYSKYCPYNYNLSAAKTTLEKAGFKEVGGVMTYEGSTGALLPPKGSPLSFTVLYPTGDSSAADEMLLWQSALKSIGVVALLKAESFDEELAEVNQSKSTINSWDAADLTNLWYLYPNIYPTGDIDYQCGGGGDFGGYCNPTMNTLVDGQLFGTNGIKATWDYVKYAAQQLPGMLNIPTPQSLIEVKNTVRGFTNVQLNPAFASLPYPELLSVSS